MGAGCIMGFTASTHQPLLLVQLDRPELDGPELEETSA
jgi:hypothetical protein